MRLLILLAAASLSATTMADTHSFTTGPVIEDFGPVVGVNATMPMPDDVTLRHSFDAARGAENGEPNRTLESAARFINMHARAGVPVDSIALAIVVHGTAVYDVSGDAKGNADLVAALLEHGVRIIVCGQSAASRGVAADDLLPGVELALSAMTAHALLQQEGYTINPF